MGNNSPCNESHSSPLNLFKHLLFFFGHRLRNCEEEKKQTSNLKYYWNISVSLQLQELQTCCMRTIKYNNKFFGYLACKPSSFTFPIVIVWWPTLRWLWPPYLICTFLVSNIMWLSSPPHTSQSKRQNGHFLCSSKRGSQNATPGAEVSISCTKMEGVDKLSSHLEWSTK